MVRNEDPKLPVETTVVVLPEMHLALRQSGPLVIRFLRFSATPRTGPVQAEGSALVAVAVSALVMGRE